MSAVDIADWRLRTFALYANVRKIAAEDPAEAHSYWRQERDRMFGTHPASPLTAAAKASFGGLKTADYDPIYRFHIPLTSEGAGREMTVETGTDGAGPVRPAGHLRPSGDGAAGRVEAQGLRRRHLRAVP